MKAPVRSWAVAVSLLAHGAALGAVLLRTDVAPVGVAAAGIEGVEIALTSMAGAPAEPASSLVDTVAAEPVETDPVEAEPVDAVPAEPVEVAEAATAEPAELPEPPPELAEAIEPLESAEARPVPAETAAETALAQVTEVTPETVDTSAAEPTTAEALPAAEPVAMAAEPPPPPPPAKPMPPKTPAAELPPVAPAPPQPVQQAALPPAAAAPATAPETATATSTAAAAAATPPASAAETLAAVPAGAAGEPAPDYLSELSAWLERHKEYPRRARQRHQEGTALLRFVIDRDGRLLSYRVEKSSGHAALDQAVEEMIERASPLPPMPADMQQARLEIAVPISFYLR